MPHVSRTKKGPLSRGNEYHHGGFRNAQAVPVEERGRPQTSVYGMNLASVQSRIQGQGAQGAGDTGGVESYLMIGALIATGALIYYFLM